MIKWATNKTEINLISKIVQRANTLYPGNKLNLAMDITATHCNGNPLRLKELLEADDFNFSHDVLGIRRTINRKTGKLTNEFLPRYSQRP